MRLQQLYQEGESSTAVAGMLHSLLLRPRCSPRELLLPGATIAASAAAPTAAAAAAAAAGFQQQQGGLLRLLRWSSCSHNTGGSRPSSSRRTCGQQEQQPLRQPFVSVHICRRVPCWSWERWRRRSQSWSCMGMVGSWTRKRRTRCCSQRCGC